MEKYLCIMDIHFQIVQVIRLYHVEVQIISAYPKLCYCGLTVQ